MTHKKYFRKDYTFTTYTTDYDTNYNTLTGCRANMVQWEQNMKEWQAQQDGKFSLKLDSFKIIESISI